MSISVQVARSAEQLEQVRSLMRSFISWHRQHHREDIHLIEQYFDAAAFEEELASLPGKYVPPRGQLLLAALDEAPAGCVALREINDTACEMKRMFVYPRFHGKGIGRDLAEVLINEARNFGYTRMLLDTSFRQNKALMLYQRLGFQVVQPYYELPKAQRNWLVFMELKL
jgi:putative acetyltransferase